MVGYGRVVGGDFLNGTVSTPVGSTLVLKAGLKFRKLNPENVAEWDEVVPDSRGNAVSLVGKAVAGAVLPGTFGKAASAAVGASLDAMAQSRVVRIDWADGKTSLIKLPGSLFKHVELVLQNQRAQQPEPTAGASTSANTAGLATPPTMTEQAFSLVSGLIKDRRQASPVTAEAITQPVAQPDFAEQITKLAALRDQGILTDNEFATKKAELLARL